MDRFLYYSAFSSSIFLRVCKYVHFSFTLHTHSFPFFLCVYTVCLLLKERFFYFISKVFVHCACVLHYHTTSHFQFGVSLIFCLGFSSVIIFFSFPFDVYVKASSSPNLTLVLFYTSCCF